MKKLLALCFLVYVGLAVFHVFKSMPAGLNYAGKLRPASDVAFLIDSTYRDANGEPIQEQEIFDEALRLVSQARKLVVVDMFLFNAFAAQPEHRPLTRELTWALIAKKRARPGMPVVLITDPLNTFYGGVEAPHLEQLREAGVRVVVTDLAQLRDSNPSWSGLWRLCCQWFGNTPDGGWLPNALGPGEVTLRSYLALLNFKANHRKTVVVDEGETWTGLVSSANPHDASSAHSNTALRFSGQAALDLLRTEVAVMGMHDRRIPFTVPDAVAAFEAPAQIQILTEAAIRDAALDVIHAAEPGSQLHLSQFYFTHRALVEALVSAHEREVSVRVILDPNKDAFGREKSGLPNRQVALELHEAGIPVRWCATHGEQCHSKLLLVIGPGNAELIMGSANYTRRNLDNYNLETNARLVAPADFQAVAEAQSLFNRRWNNAEGHRYTVEYEAFADESVLRYWQYRVMEFTGWSTF